MTRRDLRTADRDYIATAATGCLRTGDAVDNGMRRRAADARAIRGRALILTLISALTLAMLLHALV